MKGLFIALACVFAILGLSADRQITKEKSAEVERIKRKARYLQSRMNDTEVMMDELLYENKDQAGSEYLAAARLLSWAQDCHMLFADDLTDRLVVRYGSWGIPRSYEPEECDEVLDKGLGYSAKAQKIIRDALDKATPQRTQEYME